MSYAKVQDKKVISEGACPVNLKNISGFYRAPDSFKIEHGYYPVKIISKPQKQWQIKTGQTYKIKTDCVEKTIIYLDIALDEYKSRRVEELNSYLTPKYPALYKQINASRGDIYTKEENVIILDSVTTWRNYFYFWKGKIEDCKTFEEVKAINYITTEDKKEDII